MASKTIIIVASLIATCGNLASAQDPSNDFKRSMQCRLPFTHPVRRDDQTIYVWTDGRFCAFEPGGNNPVKWGVIPALNPEALRSKMIEWVGTGTWSACADAYAEHLNTIYVGTPVSEVIRLAEKFKLEDESSHIGEQVQISKKVGALSIEGTGNLWYAVSKERLLLVIYGDYAGMFVVCSIDIYERQTVLDKSITHKNRVSVTRYRLRSPGAG